MTIHLRNDVKRETKELLFKVSKCSLHRFCPAFLLVTKLIDLGLVYLVAFHHADTKKNYIPGKISLIYNMHNDIRHSSRVYFYLKIGLHILNIGRCYQRHEVQGQKRHYRNLLKMHIFNRR